MARDFNCRGLGAKKNDEIVYWGPRVMCHKTDLGFHYAVHEVYFGHNDQVVAYTEDALSPRCTSVEGLKEKLVSLANSTQQDIELGDMSYMYDKDTILFWLEFIDEKVIDYETP